jgi:hypothetical protein
MVVLARYLSYSRAAELAVFDVEVELAAALGLAGVPPVDRFRSLAVEGDGDHRPLRVRVRGQAIDGVGDLRLHPCPVVPLR